MDFCIHNYYLEAEGQDSPLKAPLGEADGVSTDENPWDTDQTCCAG